MEKNKKLSSLNRKKDFDFLKKEAEIFTFRWLKALFLYKQKDKSTRLAWVMPKKYIKQAVLRNRLKRMGREVLKKSAFKGSLIVFFLKREKGFYKNLKRKEFNIVFEKLLLVLDKKAKKSA